jgi:hypothetical protein
VASSFRRLRRPGTLGAVPIDTLASTIDRVCRVLRTMAVQLEESGLAQQSRLLDHAATALTAELRQLLAAPDDATPPDGTYLDRIAQDLSSRLGFLSPDGARYLVSQLLEARSLLHRARPALEIAGDADVLLELDTFVASLDRGPTLPPPETPTRRRTGG